MPKIQKYNFCTLNFYESYMVAVVNKDVHLAPVENQVLIDAANDFYGNNPFVYITHRKYSYSVDPIVFIKTAKMKSLLGVAVVADVPVSKGNAEIEKLFYNKPYEIFSVLEDAIEWAKQLVKNG
jgi:hypothetical protein